MTTPYDNDLVLIEWCESLMTKGEYDEAEKFAKVLREANDHPSLLLLARALAMNDKSKKASRLLNFHIEQKIGTVGPEMFEILQLNGKILAAAGKLKASEKNLKHALRVLPNDECFDNARANTEYQLASLLAALGKFQSAQELFNKAMTVNCDNGWKTNARIIDLFVSERSKTQKPLFKESFEHIKPKDHIKGDTNLVYLVSGDLGYCKKFAASLVKQIGKIASKKLHLHIHGVSVGKNDAGLKNIAWESLNKKLIAEGVSVSFSRHHIDLKALETSQVKSIYSFERFRILPNILDIFDMPVLVADIDQLPLKDPTTLLENNFDIALLRFPKNVLNILSVISATLSIFRPTSEGKAVARELSQYFTDAMDNKAKLNWHIDQAGLAVMDYKNQNADIFYLDPKTVATDPTKHNPKEALDNGASFWSITNSIEGNSKELDLFESVLKV